MRLSLILESPQQQAEQLAQRLGLSAEEVVLQCNQISKKYWKWVLQQWYGNKISLPDDSAQIQDVLEKFATVSRRLLPSQKEINQYQSLEEIEQIVNELEGVPASSKTHDLSKYIGLDGVKVIHKDGPYVTLEISNVEALKELGEGTRWCTRGSHPECHAQSYIDRYGKVNIIFQNGRPVLQYCFESSAFKYKHLVNDAEINDYRNKRLISNWQPHRRLLSLIPAPDFSDPLACSTYARYVIQDRWPEAEPYIMKEPRAIYAYTSDVIKGRWYEAEPYFMENPKIACDYAAYIIKGRWPEAEPYIMKDPESAWFYAVYLIKSRWPEAESYIMKDPVSASNYAISIIGGRWPKAEKYIMKNPHSAYIYAREVIKGRWAKAEPYIIKSSYAVEYARDVIQGDWPEAGITL